MTYAKRQAKGDRVYRSGPFHREKEDGNLRIAKDDLKKQGLMHRTLYYLSQAKPYLTGKKGRRFTTFAVSGLLGLGIVSVIDYAFDNHIDGRLLAIHDHPSGSSNLTIPLMEVQDSVIANITLKDLANLSAMTDYRYGELLDTDFFRAPKELRDLFPIFVNVSNEKDVPEGYRLRPYYDIPHVAMNIDKRAQLEERIEKYMYNMERDMPGHANDDFLDSFMGYAPASLGQTIHMFQVIKNMDHLTEIIKDGDLTLKDIKDQIKLSPDENAWNNQKAMSSNDIYKESLVLGGDFAPDSNIIRLSELIKNSTRNPRGYVELATQVIYNLLNKDLRVSSTPVIFFERDSSEILATRSGICEDYSQLLMTLIRMVDIPAKNIVVKLSPDHKNYEDFKDVLHAMTMFKIYDNGKIDTFHADPTNGLFFDENQIRQESFWEIMKEYSHEHNFDLTSFMPIQLGGSELWPSNLRELYVLPDSDPYLNLASAYSFEGRNGLSPFSVPFGYVMPEKYKDAWDFGNEREQREMAALATSGAYSLIFSLSGTLGIIDREIRKILEKRKKYKEQRAARRSKRRSMRNQNN